MKKSSQVLYEFRKDDPVQLRYLPWNREVTLRRDLLESMQKRGFTTIIDIVKTDVVDGQPGFYVVDGSNRVRAAFELGLPVTAKIIEEEFKTEAELVEYVGVINNTQKPWTTMDYVRAFAILGYEEYKTLRRFAAKYAFFTIVTIAAMLHGFRTRTSGGATSKLRNGTFKINYLEATKYSLNLTSRLVKYQRPTSRMALAIHYVANMKDFNEKVFIENYKRNAEKIKELKLDDYTDIFSGWRK